MLRNARLDYFGAAQRDGYRGGHTCTGRARLNVQAPAKLFNTDPHTGNSDTDRLGARVRFDLASQPLPAVDHIKADRLFGPMQGDTGRRTFGMAVDIR